MTVVRYFSSNMGLGNSWCCGFVVGLPLDYFLWTMPYLNYFVDDHMDGHGDFTVLSTFTSYRHI